MTKALILSGRITALLMVPSALLAATLTVTPTTVGIASIVASSTSGTEVVFQPGLYRLLQLVPPSGVTVTGSPGTILNGSVVATTFGRTGSLWTIPNQFQQGQVHGTCDSQHAGCGHPEDLYFDDVPLTAVTSVSLVSSGKWFFDYIAHTVYFADNPIGHKIEIGSARSAFSGSASGVTIQGFVVEKYAVPAQFGAIGDQYPGPGWTVKNNEVRLNHGCGVFVSSGSVVTSNYIHQNGQRGVATSSSTGVLVQGNEIAFNNYAGFEPTWDAGGFKGAVTDGLMVKGNYVHDNAGPGLWSDIDSTNTTYTGNSVQNNAGAGIILELSYHALVTDNTVGGNAVPVASWLWGAQIMIQNSSYVEVSENVVNISPDRGNGMVIIQQNRGFGPNGSYAPINNYLHNNTVTYQLGSQAGTGMVADYNEASIPTSNNRFDYNHYHLADTTAYRWVWGQYENWANFQVAGQEVHGSVDSLIPTVH